MKVSIKCFRSFEKPGETSSKMVVLGIRRITYKVNVSGNTGVRDVVRASIPAGFTWYETGKRTMQSGLR